MKGIPAILQTAQDWHNATGAAERDARLRPAMIARLQGLKASRFTKALKAGAPTAAEEQTPEHFEDVLDPRSAMARAGLTGASVDALLSRLGGEA